VTPLLWELHWLRMRQRIDYKLAVLIFRCLYGPSPYYLAEGLHRVTEVDSRRHLRSASTNVLAVPPTRRSIIGDRAFTVAKLPVFKRQLKTALFARAVTTVNATHFCAPRSRLLILLIFVRCPSSRSTLRHLNHIRLLTN